MSGKILPLPESVRSQLRSGITITSVAQCVEELVLNSLDANATCIAVRVDFGIFRIQIVDNGYGIRHGDLKYLGTRHATSKCHTLDDINSNLSHYGFRGEALASIVDMAAIVDITTKPRGSTQTFSKLFTYGKEKSVSLVKTPRPSTGTTLTVQDFMYNMPVRRKLIKEAIDIESIRKRLESFALMHPKVSFSLRNDKNGTLIMQTSKCTSIMSIFLQLFGADKAQALAGVEHTLDQFSISGYISTQPHLTKALQFVYVNKRVILKTKIHKMLNWLLARSSIISSRLHPSSTGPGKTPSSPAKGMNLYGIYLINIECPYSDYDICLEPTKTLVEFKDWDKLLICIEEMILKFIQEENLVISIDERYRRSGKNQEMEDEGSLTMTQNSPSLLDMFSLKRAGEESSAPGLSREKYGHTLCTQDNLLAVHSLPVKRAKKSHNKFDRFSSINTNEDDTEDIDIHKNTIQGSSFTSKESGKNKTSEDGHLEFDSSTPLISMFESKLQRIDNIYKSNSSTKDILETENISTGMSSSLEQFKKFIDDDSLESNKLLSEKGTSSLNNIVAKTGAPLLKKNPDISENGEYESEPPKNISSLEEFMNFYNADRKKTELESYKTPQQAVRCTPSTPPPLNITRSSLHTSEKLKDNLDFDTNLRSNIKENNEKKSLTKSLASRLKKHQTKTKTIQTLQNFGYNKTNAKPGYTSCTSDNTSKFTEQKVNKCCDRTRHDVLSSWEDAETSVQGLEQKQKKVFNDDDNDLNSSFRFQPVISKKTEPKNDMREYLSDGERFVKYLEVNDDHSLCYSKPRRQEPNISVEREPLISSVPSDKICCTKEVHHETDLERSKFLLDTTENLNTCSYINTTLEQPNKYIHQLSEVPISHEKERSYCQNKLGRIIEGFDPVGLINKVIQPLESSKSNCGSVKSITVLEEKLDMTTFPLAVVTEHDPPLLHLPSLVHSRKENVEESDQRIVSDFAPSIVVSAASCSTQPFELENISYINKPCNRLHSEDMQGRNCAIIQESQGFTLSDLSSSLQNRKVSSGLSCENKEENISAAIQFSEGFTPQNDLNENVNNDITITAAPKTRVRSLDSNPSTIYEEMNDTQGITNTIADSNNGNDILEEYEQSYIFHQKYKKEELKDINSCDRKITNVVIRSHSQPPASQNNMDRKFLHDNTIQNERLQYDENNFEMKKKHILPLLSSLDIQNNIIDITDSNNKIVDEETNLPSSKSPNPLSESLHFSQLTIPEDMVEALQKSQGTSSINTCDSEKIESMALSLGSLSSCSSGMIPKAKQQLPSCEITFHGKMVHVGRGNFGTQKGNLGNTSDGLQYSVNTASLNKKSCALIENIKSMSSDLEPLNSKSEDNIIKDVDENKAINNQIYNDVTLCSSKDNYADQQNTQDDSTQGVNNAQNDSTQGVNNAQNDSTQGVNNAQNDSTQGVNNAQDDSTQRVNNAQDDSTQRVNNAQDDSTQGVNNAQDDSTQGVNNALDDSTQGVNNALDDSIQGVNALDDSTQGVNNAQDDSTQGVNNAVCPGNRWKEVYDESGRKVYVHLKTGNTSYDPPPNELIPEWTSSQPLGAPLLKVPLTHEPWYNPLGKATANRQAFTLSHGFSSFLSWKKAKDIEQNVDLSRKSKYSTGSNRESSLNNTYNTESNIQEKEGNKPVAVSEDDSLLTAEVSEAIALLLKDFENDEDNIKWSSKPTELHQDKSESTEVAEICQMWEAPQFAMDADILTSEVQATSAERGAITKKGAVVRVYNIVHPYKFSREMLQSCKVIGQLDKKFIACSITYSSYDCHEPRPSELIVLFDQHAVHERVRLEAIIEENFETLDCGETVVRSSTITPPLEMSLPEDEVRIMMAFSEIFMQRGLHFTQINSSRVSFQSIPSCLVAKEENEVRHKRCQTASAIVESIIRDMCHTLHQTAGVVGVVPKPITYVLNSMACRGAVKFGDELPLSQCQELISSLCSCQLPFQCAHGRPSIVPIVNLTHLTTINRKENKPNLHKLKDAV